MILLPFFYLKRNICRLSRAKSKHQHSRQFLRGQEETASERNRQCGRAGDEPARSLACLARQAGCRQNEDHRVELIIKLLYIYRYIWDSPQTGVPPNHSFELLFLASFPYKPSIWRYLWKPPSNPKQLGHSPSSTKQTCDGWISGHVCFFGAGENMNSTQRFPAPRWTLKWNWIVDNAFRICSLGVDLPT